MQGKTYEHPSGTSSGVHREDGFYFLPLKNDDEAIRNAFYNPGTLKVVNEVTHKVVWNIT